MQLPHQFCRNSSQLVSIKSSPWIAWKNIVVLGCMNFWETTTTQKLLTSKRKGTLEFQESLPRLETINSISRLMQGMVSLKTSIWRKKSYLTSHSIKNAAIGVTVALRFLRLWLWQSCRTGEATRLIQILELTMVGIISSNLMATLKPKFKKMKEIVGLLQVQGYPTILKMLSKFKMQK